MTKKGLTRSYHSGADDGADAPDITPAVAPLPLPLALMFILLGLGLIPVLGLAARRTRGPRPLLSAAYAVWLAAMAAAAAHLALKLGPTIADARAGKVFDAIGAALAPWESAAAVAVLTGLAGSLLSFAILYIHRRHEAGDSLFSAFFTIVAALSATLSSFTSFLGVQLVFQTETPTLFSNWVLPFLLSAFILVFALALWIGGADLIKTRHWQRPGGGNAALGFLERLSKWLILALPALALFVLSTWTSALGLGGRDAVRLHYELEIARLSRECERAIEAPRNEEAFLASLDQTVENLIQLAREEGRGALSGIEGAGPATNYLERLSGWLAGIAAAARGQITPDPKTALLEQCVKDARSLGNKLKAIETANFKKWERSFALAFDKMRLAIGEQRKRPSVITFVEAQLDAMDLRVVPPALGDGPAAQRLSGRLADYTAQVQQRLRELIARHDRPPPEPLPPTPVWTVAAWIAPPAGAETAGPDERGELPRLAQISARQAIWQYGYRSFDIWAFAIAWDFASYALMILYVFFPGLDRRRAEA